MKHRIWLRLILIGGLLLPFASERGAADDGGTWAYTGSLNIARLDHTATLLLNGQVLVAAGQSEGGYQSSAELYDPASGQWTLTGSMATARAYHEAVGLLDGRVLVIGGVGPNGNALASTELYDPATGSWTPTGSMHDIRVHFSATRLSDGRVLVTGGFNGWSMLSGAETYDPDTGQWTLTSAMNYTHDTHMTTLLLDGRVLVSGGMYAGAEVYDPTSDEWTLTGSMATYHQVATATLLPDGRVLVAGGWISGSIGVSELYDPATNQWTETGSLNAARFHHTAAPLPDGTVLVAGGNQSGETLRSSEAYDPATGLWTLAGTMNAARADHTSTVLSDGRVLVTGGSGDPGLLSTTEVYTPEIDNSPPVAADDAYAALEDTLLGVPAPGVLANDTDPNGDPLTAVLDAPPGTGTLTLNDDGAFAYMPPADFSGEVTFTYHSNDGLADSNIATVTITVSPIGDPPTALNDVYATEQDTLLTVPAPGVLLNDTDADGDPLSAILDTAPGSGTLTLYADGSFSYVPASGFVGAVTFTYHAYDGQSGSNVAVVTITITPAAHAPVAVDDAYTALIDTLTFVDAPGVLANDTDDQGHPLTAVLDTPPSLGALGLSADGSFSYLPAVDFTGEVTFTYHASDGTADSQSATVTLTVKPIFVYLPLVVQGLP